MVYFIKKNGSIRPCVDYRKLNDRTLKDAYPLLRMEMLNFSQHLTLQGGYWQISVAEEDKEKTAFVTRSGLYVYNTFGLCNDPSTFQRCLVLVFKGSAMESSFDLS